MAFSSLRTHLSALDTMKKYPSKLFFSGNQLLLEKQKVSIIGSRKPNAYSKMFTQKLALELSKRGVIIVSGAAMGVDAIAHRGAGNGHTIAVLPTGLSVRYPKVNASLITGIENEGLLLSQFDEDFRAAPWSFVVRNELVVALGEVLIVTHADLNSGSMRSVEFAQKMGKKIYVLPHHIGESEGTNTLLSHGLAEAIYDVDSFCDKFGTAKITRPKTPFLEFCETNPSYETLVARYAVETFEAELNGSIYIERGVVYRS